jgi:hypothetical protein
VTSRAPAQPRRPGFPGRWPKSRGHNLILAAVLAASTAVAACSAPTPTVSSGPESSGPAAPSAGAPRPEGNPTAAAQGTTGASPSSTAPASPGVSAAVEAALRTLVASLPQPSTAQVRESLSAAGFAPAAVEVSASRTPTGLAADAVEVGVLGGNECVMAQLRSGTVATSVLPVLPNGRCFIGSVQR